MLPEQLLVAEAVLHRGGHIPHGGAGLQSAIGGSRERDAGRTALRDCARSGARLPVRAAGTRAAPRTAAAPTGLRAGPPCPGRRRYLLGRPRHRNLRREEGTEPADVQVRRVFHAAQGRLRLHRIRLTAFSPESDRPPQERGLIKGRGQVLCVGEFAHSQLQPFALTVSICPALNSLDFKIS